MLPAFFVFAAIWWLVVKVLTLPMNLGLSVVWLWRRTFGPIILDPE
jgi:hypothetical protein